MDMVRENSLLDGITLSGGDPFEQAETFALLAKVAKGEGYHITTYTGYTFEQLVNPEIAGKGWSDLLLHTDLLVDGPFIARVKNGLLKFRGSENQRLIDVPSPWTVLPLCWPLFNLEFLTPLDLGFSSVKGRLFFCV